jgi:hypothetical protein
MPTADAAESFLEARVLALVPPLAHDIRLLDEAIHHEMAALELNNCEVLTYYNFFLLTRGKRRAARRTRYNCQLY